MIWRVDVVRLLPQTAAFYKMVGLEVNLRGLAFKDIKITTETVDGKPVLVIEGVIVGETRKPVELPRLRFSRARRAGRRDLRLECGAGAAGAEAGRTRLVQVAAGLAAARRPQYRRTLLQQAGHRRRPRLNRATASALAEDGCPMPRVLIADDEDSMRTLVARAIAMDGHATVTARGRRRSAGNPDPRTGRIRSAAHRHPDAGDGRHRAGAGRRARFSRADDSADDGLCRSARTRLTASTRSCTTW